MVSRLLVENGTSFLRCIFLVDMKFMVVLSLIKSRVACFYLSVLFSCKFFTI